MWSPCSRSRCSISEAERSDSGSRSMAIFLFIVGRSGKKSAKNPVGKAARRVSLDPLEARNPTPQQAWCATPSRRIGGDDMNFLPDETKFSDHANLYVGIVVLAAICVGALLVLRIIFF